MHYNMQYYYVYNQNEQLHRCIAQHLKMIDDQTKLVAISDTEGQERLMNFLGTSQPHIFLLPLVITVQEDTRNVLSTQHMYDWISDTCQRAEARIGADRYSNMREEAVKASIHPTVLKILRKADQSVLPEIQPASAIPPPPPTKAVSQHQGAIADEQGAHWGDHAIGSTGATKDANSRVSISDAMQSGKQREVGISPVAQATRR